MADAGGCARPDAKADADAVRAFLTGPLAKVLDEPEEGPFQDNASYLRTYEALTTLQVIAYKLASECQQRVLSFGSRDFGDATATAVLRAMGKLPDVQEWVRRLRDRLDARSPLALLDGSGLPPRLLRVCEVYELSKVESEIVGALLMMRVSHAFGTIKLGSASFGGYGGGGGLYSNSTKASITMAAILNVNINDMSNFQKAERKHVKQGVLLPASASGALKPSLRGSPWLALRLSSGVRLRGSSSAHGAASSAAGSRAHASGFAAHRVAAVQHRKGQLSHEPARSWATGFLRPSHGPTAPWQADVFRVLREDPTFDETKLTKRKEKLSTSTPQPDVAALGGAPIFRR